VDERLDGIRDGAQDVAIRSTSVRCGACPALLNVTDTRL
jgi:hypothetical protein